MLGGREVSTAGGSFCLRRRELKLGWPLSCSPTLIYTNLQLVWGIGPVTEARFKAAGINTLDQLTVHPALGLMREGCWI